ncbi:hypothetical protein ATEIFO6365_0004056800 [Aspergillus terreus]|uniref:Uncharacterized protein n=1 Tax=Aspergillus terreus TaxID=33178 RepID=A0A5M3YPR4_ASPTE|nr:hypothetical protein ATETN484_0002059300 [Aspergillus terreus]GFF15449.1 hypothetical protein ATEIFO6365_0004056800 [Aspergillus terreus]
MSQEYASYRPRTPPRTQWDELVRTAHARNTSESSIYSNDSSPWSAATSVASPIVESPPCHHHGQALLPKIRSQDVVIEPPPVGGPQRHRRVLSNTRNPPGFLPYPPSRPSIQRTVGETTERFALASPISPMYRADNRSTLSSPVDLTHKRKTSGGHARSGSCSNIDEAALGRYGCSPYRPLSKYSSQPQASPTAPVTPVTPNIIVYPPHVQSPGGPRARSGVQVPLVLPGSPHSTTHVPSAQCSPVTLGPHVESMNPQSTTLLSYLTAPTQAINLVRNVSVVPNRGLHDYFWWDIRNLRSWSSFSTATFDSINGLTKLLKTAISSHLTPAAMVPPSRLAPESEAALINLISDIYAPRVNAAIAVSQGEKHLTLYAAPAPRLSANKNHGGAHFLANYSSDTERTSTGLPRGRLVGIVKSFDRWNTGMRNEAPHRRVEYLKGLAHLQRCMREHSCRYGFIITEIELVCVRAGCDEGDDVPYFGFLEVSAPIPTNVSARPFENNAHPPQSHNPLQSPASPDGSLASPSSVSDTYPVASADSLNVPMTASLGLYFLLMLSKAVPLPSQPSSHLNVGGPGALTRQRVLPEGKDKWIPEPQIGERRDAKRVRGWVWPQDAWHRREGGGASRGRGAVEGRMKKWHK